jgi:hypothetical protein
MRLSENVYLLRYPHPSALRRTFMYASFLRISEALPMDVFHQPLRGRFFDSLYPRLCSPFENAQRASRHQVTRKDGGIP